jgi:putative addiction module killer protein
MELGNLSNVRSVGSGVSEYRIDFGPGYRIYLGRDGDTSIVLLGSSCWPAGRNNASSATSRLPRRCGRNTGNAGGERGRAWR